MRGFGNADTVTGATPKRWACQCVGPFGISIASLPWVKTNMRTRVRTVLSVLLLPAFAAFGQAGKPSPPKPHPASLLDKNTLFTVYGRGFGIAPILGRLGAYKDIDAMALDTKNWVKLISAANDGKGVVIGIHLIYGIAIPCTHKGQCLQYPSEDIVEKYIKPAAARGWAVILDTQLGRSDPVTEVQRMIDKGYLAYDNVHVALDPEFHARAGQPDPGIPVGTISAAQINDVQQILDSYVTAQNLKTKKIVIVHQFGDPAVHDGVPNMIEDKKTLKVFGNVDLVIDGDGLGSPVVKIQKYNLMTNAETYPFVHFRGIKIFFPNQWEKHGHFDKPPMTVDQIFGLKPIPGGPKVSAKPDLVTIA